VSGQTKYLLSWVWRDTKHRVSSQSISDPRETLLNVKDNIKENSLLLFATNSQIEVFYFKIKISLLKQTKHLLILENTNL